ncbi:hypothetical protein PMAYCL1PPCAC_14215, partial [Pristionchus mayeri]
KDSSATVEVRNRRRSTRNISKSVKYADSMEESDKDDEPTLKKVKSEATEVGDKIVPRKRKSLSKGPSQSKTVKTDNTDMENKTEKNELECPECDYSTKNAKTWETHLRDKHSTTPALARCVLRCDCGNESYSKKHSEKCEISNFTIIRKGDGPIRRIEMTPQCVLCKIHPKTPKGYSDHLKVHHKTTLKANGLYLTCSCGMKYKSDYVQKKHDKKCTGREFTLHKLVFQATPKCVLCEMHPKSPYGYSAHLYFHHKTTLRANGIYLLCSCGFRYNFEGDHKKHDKKCTGREFTLHKLD